MKRSVLAVILVLTLVFSLLSACSNGSNGSTADTGQSTVTGDAGSSSQASGDAVELTFATFLPEGNPANGCIKLMQDKINEQMGGRYVITPFYNGTLLGQSETLDGIKSGVADIGYIMDARYLGNLELLQILDLASIKYNGPVPASWVMHDVLQGKTGVALAELDDVVVLFGFSVGTSAFTTKNQITSVNSLKGIQLNTPTNMVDFLSATGATPVEIAWPEVYEAIRNGLVEGYFGGAGNAANALFQEITSNCLVTPFASQGHLLVMNKAKFNAMSAEDQAGLLEISEQVFEEYASRYPVENKDDVVLQKFIKELDTFDGMDIAMQDEFQKIFTPVSEKYVATLDAKGLPATEFYNEVRALADHYNEIYTWDEFIDNWLQYK